MHKMDLLGKRKENIVRFVMRIVSIVASLSHAHHVN